MGLYTDFINRTFDILFKPHQAEKRLALPRTGKPINQFLHQVDDWLTRARNWQNKVITNFFLWSFIFIGGLMVVLLLAEIWEKISVFF